MEFPNWTFSVRVGRESWPGAPFFALFAMCGAWIFCEVELWRVARFWRRAESLVGSAEKLADTKSSEVGFFWPVKLEVGFRVRGGKWRAH